MKTNLYLTTFGKLPTAAEPVASRKPIQTIKPMTIMLASIRARYFLRSAPRTGLFVWLGLLFVLAGLFAPDRAGAVGSLTASTTAPGRVGLMRLLSDGTVMAQSYNGSNWYRLTPDIHGSYSNGTWSNTASMNYSHGYCSSQVLEDGRLLIAGGEYGNGENIVEVFNPTNNIWTIKPAGTGMMVQILFNPTNNIWTIIPVPAGLLGTGGSGSGFLDSGSTMLPDGKVLIVPVYSAYNNGTVIFNPTNSSLSPGPASLTWLDESSLVKLPDGSVLTIDPYFPTLNQFGTNSERYIPSLNQWTRDANVPVGTYSTNDVEMG